MTYTLGTSFALPDGRKRFAQTDLHSRNIDLRHKDVTPEKQPREAKIAGAALTPLTCAATSSLQILPPACRMNAG